MTKHPHPHWSLPRGSKKRAEVAAEQAIARYGTPSAAEEATGIPLGVLEAAEARINEAEEPPPSRQRPADELMPCGTVAAYRRHLRRKQQPCEPCCTEWARRRALERQGEVA